MKYRLIILRQCYFLFYIRFLSQNFAKLPGIASLNRPVGAGIASRPQTLFGRAPNGGDSNGISWISVKH